MATNAKGADFIGKTIVVVNNDKIKYVIKSVEDDKLMTDFCMEGRDPMPCPVPMEQLTKMVDAGTWRVDGATATETKVEDVKPETCEPETKPETTATDEVEEVEEIVVEPAKTVKMEQPKDEPKKKSDKPKAKGGSRGQAPDSPQATHQGASPRDAASLRYEEYTNKKGRPCARIVGFKETDAAYQKETAALLHGAQRPVDGVPALSFGKAYKAFAKLLCDALNDGKSIDDCKKLLADYETGRTQAKAEETTEASPHDPAEDYAVEMIERLMRGDELPESIVKRLDPETVKAFMAKAA